MATGDAAVTTRGGKRDGLFGFQMTPGRGVSWGAVFAGLVIGMALQIVLTLLGVAIGLGAADDSAQGASIGAGIWALIAALISAWIGGRVAGAAARSRQRGDGAFHGILAWALSTLIAIWLLSSGVGRILGGAANMAGNVMGGATAGAAQGAAVRPNQVEQTARGAAQEAQAQIDQTNMDSVRQEGREAAETTREVAKSAVWLALLAMGLAAAASAWGGASAARDDVDDDIVVARSRI